ncbi:MFS transporter [Marinagarivorans cellulosilyticus]|uniref:Glycoside/pentoside/hexuronide:cation symporter, GPH family n=1 Tax=Marinagarivorans cellulosilyticus TaxID=2721545 RepID=A0AAN1WGB1_9GAMM|nr:MFS transporter [Marinagarivorans cellulosilyticus]BCD97074.1 glycoside/pentoside/hexuronide:cation symporter, GPH family [Marinagarivorans cellulosilyticus]
MSQSNSNDRLAKLSWRERIGYGLGDAGFNFYWAIIGSYLVFFYTDIFGISAAAAATMVTVTRIVDAITDPAMGAIADRTNTRWGKFRPYLLFAALPMMGAGIMTMTTPDLDDTGKLIWAYATYGMLMLVYTILNTPYNSLSGVLTANTQERNAINSTRFFFAYFSSIIVGAATPEIAEYFGDGDTNSAYGWQMTMTVYAIIASCLFAITFFSTKERVSPPKNQEKTNPFNDFKDLMLCKPWLILFILAMVFMTTMTLRGSSSAYYFKYFVERIDLLGTYIGLQYFGLMLGAMSAAYVTRFIDKRKLLMIMLIIVGALSIAFTFIPKPHALGVVATKDTQETTLDASDLLGSQHNAGDKYEWQRHDKIFWIIKKKVTLPEPGANLDITALKGETISVKRISADGNTLDSSSIPVEIVIMFIMNFLISVALGFKPPITWAMYADVADYNEWKTGRRATGMTFSATTFSQKMGSTIGSAVLLSALAAMGYEANQIQDGASLMGIVYMQTFIPGILAIATALTLLFYKLDSKQLEDIQKELQERNA